MSQPQRPGGMVSSTNLIVAPRAGGRALSSSQRDYILLNIFVLAQHGYIERAACLAEALEVLGDRSAAVVLARAVFKFLSRDWASALCCLRISTGSLHREVRRLYDGQRPAHAPLPQGALLVRIEGTCPQPRRCRGLPPPQREHGRRRRVKQRSEKRALSCRAQRRFADPLACSWQAGHGER